MSSYVTAACRRLGIDNPWDAPHGEYEYDGHGWFPDENRSGLEQLLRGLRSHRRNDVLTVIELGSWLGKSTRWFATHADLVLAVDHWKGSREHHKPGRRDTAERVHGTYERFLSNCRKYRDTVLPLRMSTADAARLSLTYSGADLVYVDAGHDERSVYRDLVAYAPHLAPHGVLCGDDWNFGSRKGWPVRRAVTRFVSERQVGLFVDGQFWWLYGRPTISAV